MENRGFEMKKRNRNNRRAFTLAELLIVVAIIAVIVAIGIIELAGAKKNLQVKANDSNAKIIYLAAQNQMLQMKEYGQWDALCAQNREGDELNESFFGSTLETPHHAITVSGGGPSPAPAHIHTDGEQKPSDYDMFKAKDFHAPDWDDAKKDMRVIEFFPEGAVEGLNSSGLIGTVLPLGTVEDGVRTQGKYFIEYNVRTASVYGVFYTESKDGELDYVSPSFRGTFYDKGTGRPNLTQDEKDARRVRRDYKDDAGDEVILGYFGGSMAYGLNYEPLTIPEVRIDNGEELILYIRDTNSNSSYRDSTIVEITVTGKVSGGSITYTVEQPGTFDNTKDNGGYRLTRGLDTYDLVKSSRETENYIDYEIYLDSITQGVNGQNLHFAANYCQTTPGTPDLIPGEDIEVSVMLRPDGDRVTLPVKRTVETNSLFATATVDNNRGYGAVTDVKISQLRHLENLSSELSGVNFIRKNSDGTYEMNNLIVEFENSVSMDTNGSDLLPIVPKDYTGKIITKVDGSTDTGFAPGSYVPVNIGEPGHPEYMTLIVDGNDYNVFNIGINEADTPVENNNIGLFGNIFCNFNISRLGIVNSQVASTVASADVKTVFKGNALGMGAFAGYVSGEANLVKCWSTVQLKSSDARDGACIGGLLGDVSGAADIERSYVSATTVDGSFSMIPAEANIFVNASGKHVNVGGLIGNSYSVHVYHSYCAADIGFTTIDTPDIVYNLGGLAGNTAGMVRIVDSYFCGWMNVPVSLLPRKDTINYGGLIGKAGSAVIDDQSYWIKEFLGISNLEENPMNYAEDGTVRGRAREEAAVSSQPDGFDTKPYDVTLHGDNYGYRDVTMLNHHWGDWCREIPDIGLYILPGIGIGSLTVGSDLPTGLTYYDPILSDLSVIHFHNVPAGISCDLTRIVNVTLLEGFDGISYMKNGVERINPDAYGRVNYTTTGKTAIILVRADRLGVCEVLPIPSRTDVFNRGDYVLKPAVNLAGSGAYDDSVTMRKFIAFAQDADDLPELDVSVNGIIVKGPADTNYHEYTANDQYIVLDISDNPNYAIRKNDHYGKMYYKVYAFAYTPYEDDPSGVIFSSIGSTDAFYFDLRRVTVNFHYMEDYTPFEHYNVNGGYADVTRYVEYDNNKLYVDPLGSTTISSGYIANTEGAASAVPELRLDEHFENAVAIRGWALPADGSRPIQPDGDKVIYAPDESGTLIMAAGYPYNADDPTWKPNSALDIVGLYPYLELKTMEQNLDPGGGYFESDAPGG